MSKVDTDQGLGPGSERMRRDVREAQKELDDSDKKSAVTEPGIGEVNRRADTVDDLLDGFGTDRPDLPRILPKEDTTPPPEPIKKELTPTEPGKRQRTRNMVLAMAVTFGVVVGVGVLVVKLGGSHQPTQTTPTATATETSTSVVSTAQTSQSNEVVPPITTMAVESLPTVKTSAPPASTGKPVHSATTSTAATTATTHPTGSAPPGLNLLPDDPHR